MTFKNFLLSTSLLCGIIVNSSAAIAADVLEPRASVSVKGGSERSTLTTEFWAPLAQKRDRVIYTDLRLMGDDDDNREGNLGFGYRQIYKPTNSVLGVHGWIDRRRTEHNSTFHQVTLGVESLGDKIDLRANGYVPLNGSHVVTTPNLGSATPYLAGNGLFYDTNGSINETPQYGVDAEAGYRLPIFEKQIDTIRIYGGGYHFFRSNTENVTGFRIRTEATINKLLSVGARFQHDGPRGSQGFLEATLRFPFSAKKLYQTDKLRSRLDESPERDIDIVTSAKVDTGLHKEIINTTSGDTQRILYVDNTNAQIGDGTKEHPFNNLQSAQAALQANDILYVFRGDGTTHNMDQGITINQPGVQLIGSGSALSIGGYTFLNAGAAPLITNAQASLNDYTGNGVLISNDYTLVSGITVLNATGSGISVISSSGQEFINNSITNVTTSSNGKIGVNALATVGKMDNLYIQNVVTNNNALHGVSIGANQGGTIQNVYISNVTSVNNKLEGIRVDSSDAGTDIANTVIDHSNITNNLRRGIYISAQNSGLLDNVSLTNSISNNSTDKGLYLFSSNNAIINKFLVSNFTTNGNLNAGILFQTSGGVINDIQVSSVIANSNGTQGIYALATNGTIGNIFMSDVITNGNTQQGTLLQTTSGNSTIGRITLSNITATGNIFSGLQIYSTAGSMGQISVDNLIARNNTQEGFRIQTDGASSNINQVTATNLNVTGNRYGVYLYSQNSSVISNVSLSNTQANNNQIGLNVLSQTAAVINNVQFFNSTTTGNSVNGVYINKSTTGTFNVDLGGGTLSSTGLNRIFGNIGTDVRVDGGYALKARSNWWGGATVPTRVTLNGGSTIDSTGFLTTDPRP